jgi:hypothetical protein
LQSAAGDLFIEAEMGARRVSIARVRWALLSAQNLKA